MKIDLSDIVKKRNKSTSFDIVIEEDVIAGGVADDFTLEAENLEGRYLSLTGETVAHITAACDRCLADVSFDTPLDLQLKIRIEDEVLVNDGEDPIDMLVDNIIDTDEWVQEEIMLALPSKVLCTEDCKGICPVCGVNLNNSNCDCDRQVLDPRMAQFIDVFSEFKEEV